MKYDQDALILNLLKMKKRAWRNSSKQVLSLAVEEITRLQDEVDSLWNMLDEMKASDINNYRSIIEAGMTKKILQQVEKRKRIEDGTN